MDEQLDRLDIDPALDFPDVLCRVADRERKPALPCVLSATAELEGA
jgi:hypothetical protein